MKILVIYMSILMMSIVLSGCGSDREDVGDGASLGRIHIPKSAVSGGVVLKPDEIPKEYQGLSMSELREKSSNMSYAELIGSTKSDSGSTITPTDASVILNHVGTLLHYHVALEEIYPSSQEGVFTMWACSVVEAEEVSSIATQLVGEHCIDPVFLLYDLTRGPTLSKEDIVEIAGIVVGSRKKKGTGFKTSMTPGEFVTPEISVIKAAVAK